MPAILLAVSLAGSSPGELPLSVLTVLLSILDFWFLADLATLLVSILVEPPSAGNQGSHVLPDPSFQYLVSVDYVSSIIARQSFHASVERSKRNRIVSILNDRHRRTTIEGKRYFWMGYSRAIVNFKE